MTFSDPVGKHQGKYHEKVAREDGKSLFVVSSGYVWFSVLLLAWENHEGKFCISIMAYAIDLLIFVGAKCNSHSLGDVGIHVAMMLITTCHTRRDRSTPVSRRRSERHSP